MSEICLKCFTEDANCFIFIAESKTVDIGSRFSLKRDSEFQIGDSVPAGWIQIGRSLYQPLI